MDVAARPQGGISSARGVRRAAFAVTCAAAAALVAGAGEPAGGAEDWPQFRGRGRDGVAAAGEELAPWPESGPVQRWRVAIGAGYSGIAVAAGRLYTMFERDGGDYVGRFDDRDGREVWSRKVGLAYQAEFDTGPRSTPTVAGDTLFALGSRGNLFALDVQDGAPRWEVDLAQRFGVAQPRFGYTTSPLVAGELVVLQVAGEERGLLLALDRRSGATRWTVPAESAGYSSPIALTFQGIEQFVFVTLKQIVAVSAAGEVLWSRDWAGLNNIAMPIHVAPDRVLASHNDDDGAILLQLVREGGAIEARELWRSRFLKNHFSSSVVLDGFAYGFDNATLKCVDLATGQHRWAHRGLGKGSLIAAGGHLVVLSDLGELVLLAATPAEYRELARSPILVGKSWTAPALAGGRLYLRNHTEMVSLDLPPARRAAAGTNR